MTLRLTLLLSLAFAFGCSGADTNPDTENGSPDQTTKDPVSGQGSFPSAAPDSADSDAPVEVAPADPETPSCDGEATYRVTFDVTWTEANFPTDYPVEGPEVPTYDSAHLSPLIGAAHGASWAPWRPGEVASDGTEIMAESGDPSTLSAEVQSAIDAGNAHCAIRGSGVGYPPAQDGASFSVNTEFPEATVASMLAPSPDWFAGAHLTLCGDAGWLETVSVEAIVHDAGTDDGSGYNYGWQDTDPPATILPITDHLFASNNRVGTFTFVRQ